GVLQKHGEDLKRLILKLDSDSVLAQLPRIEVSLECAKADQRPNISTACHRRLRVPQSIAGSKAWEKTPNTPTFQSFTPGPNAPMQATANPSNFRPRAATLGFASSTAQSLLALEGR